MSALFDICNFRSKQRIFRDAKHYQKLQNESIISSCNTVIALFYKMHFVSNVRKSKRTRLRFISFSV